MAILIWNTTRCIENSLIDFLQEEIDSNSLKLLDESGIEVVPNVYRGKQIKEDWNLPLIQLYCDDKMLPRLEVGSNLRMKTFLIFLEIRTLLPGQEVDLADWIEEKLNNGCDYYTYEPTTDPDNPSKLFSGHTNIDFQSSNSVDLGDNVDKFDKYRYRLVLKVWLNTRRL
jgi:hypothetical protein